MTTPHKPKLIEVALPLDAISKGAVHEKNIRQSHPSSLHHWWARRPLVAVRAVIWATLVDDPSAHPDRFPTEEEQEKERQRLFGILERLSSWENSNDLELLSEAKLELQASCDNGLPDILDPFCGGGSTSLEAQRLGLRGFGGDLNPVAVLLSKAIVELPLRFADKPPVNPDQRPEFGLRDWKGSQGLSDDIRYYADWILRKAQERIGHLYPEIIIPSKDGGGKARVIAWIWARTVQSPDRSWKGKVPLVNTWVIRKSKKGKPTIWSEPVIDRVSQTINYRIRQDGKPIDKTMRGRSGAICIATGTAIPREYIKEEAIQGRLGIQLIGVAVDSSRGRIYVAPGDSGRQPLRPNNLPSLPLSTNSQYMGAPLYGMVTTDSLFINRQLLALSTFSDLVREVKSLIRKHAIQSGLESDNLRFREGGFGVESYVDTVVTYLAFAVDKLADLNNQLVNWGPDVQCPRHLFGRQAIPMIWDFAEANPLGSSSGSWKVIIEGIIRAFRSKGWPLTADTSSIIRIEQREAIARLREVEQPVIITDPPYYDNVPYADLSDFFYVWLRYNLSDIWPDELATLSTPKRDELVVNSVRSGSKEAAKEHFESGIARMLSELRKVQNIDFPATIFYAFKQQETKEGETTSTGWETFLQGLIDAELTVTATWPIRTEATGRLRAHGSATLASSIVISCRPRSTRAIMETTGGFVSALRKELPGAIRLLQQQNIAPVDMAQSAIGPGMRIFSRYSKVVEADGSAMPVRTALGLINEVLGEVLSEEEAELDADSRFALTWFEQFGYEPGPYGDADVLARAKVTAVDGVVEAGIAESRGGRVRLLRREELEEEWSPVKDKRRTDWEATQHLIRLLDRSEAEAAGLLGQLGGVGDRARQLAYLLYAVCEGKNWSEEAVAYNGLIAAWPELTRLVATTGAGQQSIL